MKKEIKWVFEGKEFKGIAALEDDKISLMNNNGSFDIIHAEEVRFGMTLEEIFEEIPEDVTDFALK